MDLALASSVGDVVPGVSRVKRADTTQVVLTDRVYEHGYLRGLLAGMFERARGVRLKSDSE